MQEFKISLKRLGKKKVYTSSIEVKEPINTLQDLIVACVKSEIARFNKTREDNQLLPFLTPSEIQKQSETGKIGFNDKYNFDQADIKTHAETAIQGYRDGLFLVFIDDQEIKSLEKQITLTPEDTITFLRMTFLTGTYY
ncbi:hypothetical protein [Aquimarina algicola]|uniref:Uncharacterized protein n=1 Tax=Aquimarina algicola TaxID=2589995 RepID=A0A504J8U5_9FLAO|nr:hypothetical protein [Aquimarina algicola]TPN83983.1 hypothetical protein FHK87_18650 [Aquimarina algicola]